MAKPKPMATPEDFDGVTLMRLRVDGAMRVKLVDMTLDRTLTTIGGDNKQGKSSLLNALRWIFGGKTVIKEIADDPIHDGKQRALITADFGRGEQVELTAIGELKRVGDDDFAWNLELIIPGFVAPTRVQEFMTKLIGDAIDPTEFDKLPDDEKFETLRKFVGDFDFKRNAAEHKVVFEERRQIGQDKRREQSAAEAIVILLQPPCERVDEAALTKELQEAGEKNGQIERRRIGREQHLQKIDELHRAANLLNEEAAELRRQADDRAARAVEKTAEAAGMQKQYDEAEPLPATAETGEIVAKLEAARADNKRLDDWTAQRKRKAEHEAAAERHSKDYDEKTAKLTELEQARQDAIAKAHLPVDGLGFGDGVVTLGGHAWKQASTAERAIASALISFAMNPKVRVILMRDASNLGSAIKKQIEDVARAKGYRVLMEVVDESGANSHIFIEDGLVKLIGGKEPPVVEPPAQKVDKPAATDTAPAKLDDEFALTAPTAVKPARKRWQGPGAPTGDA